MDKTPLCREEAEAYLRRYFRHDLRLWFTFDGLYAGCQFIPHMDDHFNPGRPYTHMINNDARRSHIFAAAFRAMIEITQSIWKGDGGEDAAVQFCKEKGWPICSAGMGGPLLDVDIMLREAKLLPEEAGSSNAKFYDDAVALFREILPGMERIA